MRTIALSRSIALSATIALSRSIAISRTIALSAKIVALDMHIHLILRLKLIKLPHVKLHTVQ